MQIVLYNTNSEYNKLDKALTSATTLSGGLVEPCNILNPQFTVADAVGIRSKNYAYVADFNRYYFIENIEFVNKCLLLTLRCDVLMSHKAAIKNSNGRITRSGNMGNPYIIDEMVSSSNHFTTQVRKLGSGFTKADNYIMTVGGSNQ